MCYCINCPNSLNSLSENFAPCDCHTTSVKELASYFLDEESPENHLSDLNLDLTTYL